MSYYDLVNTLNSMIGKDNIENELSAIQGTSVSLTGLRYVRFIRQVEYILTKRIKNFMNAFSDKIYMRNMNADEFILELSLFNSEINNIDKIIALPIINEENRQILTESVNKNINDMVDQLLKIVDNEDERLELQKYYRKEVTSNEL